MPPFLRLESSNLQVGCMFLPGSVCSELAEPCTANLTVEKMLTEKFSLTFGLIYDDEATINVFFAQIQGLCIKRVDFMNYSKVVVVRASFPYPCQY